MDIFNKIGAYILIPILGITISFILFAENEYGWCIICFLISFLVLLPLAYFLGRSRNVDNSDKVSYEDISSPVNSISPSFDYKQRVNTIQFYSELNNRQRIYADRNQIIQTTNDFSTFERRMDVLLDNIEWSYKMANEGMPVKLNMSYSEAISDYGNCFNENAVRIAKYIASLADTKQKAKNRIPKIEYIKNSLKEAPNKRGSGFAIDNLLHNLKLK